MNRWRKLLVLMLLCVTMPLQAMAALRTHCAPGTSASSMSMSMAATVVQGDTAAMREMHHATMGSDAMDAMHHHDDVGTTAMSGDAHAASQDSQSAYSHHSSCSACAACVVCTALPPNLVLRLPDAQPSTAIPFLRTSATSAVVAVLERPPKAFVA
ncbi:hypothetical protein [Pandoraea anhela]|nr:hypothetical protein [Pandoraea anhela]